MPNTIDSAQFLRKAKIYHKTAIEQPEAYSEATKELVAVAAKLDEIDKSTEKAATKEENLAAVDVPKAVESAKNKASQAIATAKRSQMGLTELENELRVELAKDPKNRDLSTTTLDGKNSVDYRNIDTAIDRTDLTDAAKNDLKETAKLIREGKVAANKVYEPGSGKDNVDEFEKAAKKVDTKAAEVSDSIVKEKAIEVYRAESAATRAQMEKEALAANEAQAAKEAAEKPFKELKEALLKEIGERKSKGSMDAITKIAEKAGLTGTNLKEVQEAAKAKTEKRSFLGKIVDAIKKSSDRKEVEITAKPIVVAALSKIPKPAEFSIATQATKSTARNPEVQVRVNSMINSMSGKDIGEASSPTAPVSGKAHSKSQTRG